MALTAAEVRALVLAAVQRALAGLPESTPLTFGGRWVRMGRWIVLNTSATGTLIIVLITRDGRGAAALRAPSAAVAAAAPVSMREAWLAGQNGEVDDDPADAPADAMRRLR